MTAFWGSVPEGYDHNRRRENLKSHKNIIITVIWVATAIGLFSVRSKS
jgi:hypothetical protein